MVCYSGGQVCACIRQPGRSSWFSNREADLLPKLSTSTPNPHRPASQPQLSPRPTTSSSIPTSALHLEDDQAYFTYRRDTMAQGDSERVREAQKVASSDPKKAEQIYKDIVSKPPSLTDAAVREYETALISLGELYRDQKSAITPRLLATSG